MPVSEQASVFEGEGEASVLARLCGRQAAPCGEKLETGKDEPVGATFGTGVHAVAERCPAFQCFSAVDVA